MATAIKKFEGTIGSTGGTTNAFDGGLISDTVYDNVTKNLKGFDKYIGSMVMNNDGTRLYVLEIKYPSQTGDANEAYIGYFPLSTAYDASTLGEYTREVLVTDLPDGFTGTTQVHAFAMNPSGTRFAVANVSDFYYYSLSTAYDFSTATLLASRSLNSGTGNTDLCAGATYMKMKFTNDSGSSYVGVAFLSVSGSTSKLSQKYITKTPTGGTFGTWGNLGYRDAFLTDYNIDTNSSYSQYMRDFAVGDYDGYSTLGANLFYFMGDTSSELNKICYFVCKNGNPDNGRALSTAIWTKYTSQSQSVSNYIINGSCIANGNMYIGDKQSNIYQFSDFEIGSDSDASVTVSYDDKFTITSQQGNSYNRTEFRFNDDGTRFFSNQGSQIYIYDLTTPYDISTRGTASTCTISNAGSSTISAFTFNREGTRFYCVPYASTNQLMFQFELDTAWTLPSTLDANAPSSGGDRSAVVDIYQLNTTYQRYINSIECNDDETIFYFHPSPDSGYQDRFQKARCATAGDIANLENDSTQTIGDNALNITWLPSRSMIIFVGSSNRNLYRKTCTNLNSATGSSISDWNTTGQSTVLSDYMNGEDDANAVHYDPNGNIFVLTTNNSSNDNVYFTNVASGTVGFPAITDQSVSNYAFSPFYRYQNPQGMFVTNSGSTLLISGNAYTYALQQFRMTTPYDLSTATIDSGKKMLLGFAGSNKIAMNNDGTKVYIGQSSTLREYALSTAYDMSSASTSYSTLSLPGSYGGLTFNSTGTKLYTSNSTSIYQYNMSTAFDISTASSAGNVNQTHYNNGSSLGAIYNVVISPDDSRMFFTTSDTIRTMYMPQPGEITSLQYSGDFFGIGGQGSDSRAFDFNGDGTKFYAIDYTTANGDIYQYTSTSSVGTDITVYTCPAATAAKVKVSMQGEFGQLKLDDNTIIEIPSKSGVYHTQDTHKAASSGTVIFSPAGGNAAFLDEFNDYFQLEAGETIKVTDARSMDYSIQIIEDSDGS